jgi:hypothetical protein
MRPAPKITQYPPGCPALTDAALLELLLAKAPLTAQQTEAFVRYATALSAGALPRLPKLARDHGIAIAKACGLLARTELKPKPRGLAIGFGDAYSTQPCTVPEAVAKQLGRIPKPVRRAS